MITIPKELKSKLAGKEQLLEESILTLKENAISDLGLEKALEKHFDETSQEELDKEWDELKHWNEIGPDASEYIESCKNKKEQENNDLCKSCKHFWLDFVIIQEVGHCEILDRKKGLSANMDNEVPYPCLECPFNSYIEKKK